MVRLRQLDVKLIIKIVILALLTIVVTLIFPMHKIPIASCSYGPDASYGWESVGKVYINQDTSLKVSYFAGRLQKVQDIRMLIHSVEGTGNLNVVMTNSEGFKVSSCNISSSQIVAGTNNIIPITTDYINQYSDYCFDFCCDGDLSIGIYSADKDINTSVNIVSDDSESSQTLLMNVDTKEYATDGFGLLIWCFLFVIYVVVFFPWKKVDKSIRSFVISLIAVLVINVYSYYSIFRGATGNSKKLFFAFALCSVLAVCLHGAIFKLCKERIQEKAWIVSIFVWGTVYLLLMPPFSYSDEYNHYAKSNEYASDLMGIESYDGIRGVYVRECDVFDNDPWTSSQLYENYYDGFFIKPSDTNYVVLPDSTIFTGYDSRLVMIPYEIGIVLGRKLGLSGAMMCTLATFMGMLVYACLIWLSIRIIPHGKWALFIIAQMPLSLSLATAFSYDYLNMSGAILFFSIVYRYIVLEEEIKWRYILILLFVGAVTFSIKYTYFPLIFLIFFIPQKQVKFFSDKWARVLKVGLIAVLIFLTFKDTYFLSRLIHFNDSNAGLKLETETISEISDIESVYPNNFWMNPSEVLSDAEDISISLFNSFYTQTDYYLFGMSGERIGMGDNFIPEYIKVLWLLILIISIIGIEKDGYFLDKRVKVCIGIIVLVCAGATFAAMMLYGTPKGYNYYPSLCTRYLLPILLPVCLLFRSDGVGLKKDIKSETIVSITDICQLIGVIYLLAGYLRR